MFFILLLTLIIMRFSVFLAKHVARRTELETTWAVFDPISVLHVFLDVLIGGTELEWGGPFPLNFDSSSVDFVCYVHIIQKQFTWKLSSIAQTISPKLIVQKAAFGSEAFALSQWCERKSSEEDNNQECCSINHAHLKFEEDVIEPCTESLPVISNLFQARSLNLMRRSFQLNAIIIS